MAHNRSSELCESRGGRPWLPAPLSLWTQSNTELERGPQREYPLVLLTRKAANAALRQFSRFCRRWTFAIVSRMDCHKYISRGCRKPQKAAASVVAGRENFITSITAALRLLHWLPVHDSILHKRLISVDFVPAMVICERSQTAALAASA